MKDNKLVPQYFFVFFIIASLLMACKEDVFPDFSKPIQAKWKPTWAAPLIKTNLSLNELIAQNSRTNLLEDQNQFLTLVFKDQYKSDPARDLVEIDNQNHQKKFSFPQASANYFNSNLDLKIEEVLKEEIEITTQQNLEIDSLMDTDLQLNLFVQSDFNKELDVEIIFPTVRIGTTKPWKKSFRISKNIPQSEKINWVDANIDLTKGTLGHSQLPIEIKISFTTAVGDNFDASQSIQFDLGFTEINFGTFYGYTGPIELFNQKKDSISVDLFQNKQKGKITFEEPRIKVQTNNQYGLPIVLDLKNFIGLSEGNSIAIQGIPQPLPVGIPKQPGEIATDSFELNTTNSNIKELINKNPKYLTYLAQGEIKPQDKFTRGFVNDSATIFGNVEAFLPLYGTASDFQIRKMASFSLDAVENPEEIESLKLHILADNSFPTDFNLAMVFYDDQGIAIDSLGLDNEFLIEGAIVDKNGFTTASKESIADIYLEKNQAQKVVAAEKVEFVVSFNTIEENGVPIPVKMYSHQNIEISFGIEAKLNLNVKE